MITRIFTAVNNLKERQITTFLFLSALVIRLVYSGYAYVSNFMDGFADDLGYFFIAEKIIDQGKIFYGTDFHLYAEMIGPGLPWVNSLTMLIFGQNWVGIFLVTSVVSALITPLIYKVAIIVTDKTTALIAGVWSVFYFFYISLSATAGKDVWMSFLLIAILYLMLKLFYVKKFSWPLFILFTLTYVYSFHLDERFLIFSPFMFLYIIHLETNGFKKIHIKKSLSFTILVLLCTIPWTIRNYNVHDKIILISTRMEPFTDKIIGYETRENVMDKYNDLYGYYYIHDYQIDSVINGLIVVTDGGYKISEKQIRAMVKGHLPEPLTGIKAFWVRTKDMLRPFQLGGEYQRSGYFYYEKSLRHNLTSFIFYGVMFFFSIPGFIYFYRNTRHIFILFISIIFVYTLIHGLLIPYTNWRYRIPLDALFIITGCYGMKLLYYKVINLSNSSYFK